VREGKGTNHHRHTNYIRSSTFLEVEPYSLQPILSLDDLLGDPSREHLDVSQTAGQSLLDGGKAGQWKTQPPRL
jgi:hypothetical protein